MNSLKDYITEKFQVDKNYQKQYAYTPKNKEALIACIKEKVKKEGYGTKDEPLDLNDIDTSQITDMSYLFSGDGEFEFCHPLCTFAKRGYFDISDWDVSNVETMHEMFFGSLFDGDLSDWDVRNVKDMSYMFAKSKFTGKNGDISNWDVSKVENMQRMFRYSEFNTDLNEWNPKMVKYMQNMFFKCPLENNPPKWYHE